MDQEPDWNAGLCCYYRPVTLAELQIPHAFVRNDESVRECCNHLDLGQGHDHGRPDRKSHSSAGQGTCGTPDTHRWG